MAWWYAAVAAVQLAGSYMGASGSKKAAKMAKQIGKLNANLIEYETQVNTTRIRQQARKLAGRQATLYAKGGVLSREGSAADVMLETEILAEQDVAITKYEGAMRKQIAIMGGQAEATRLNYAATAQLLQGAASAASTYYGGKSG